MSPDLQTPVASNTRVQFQEILSSIENLSRDASEMVAGVTSAAQLVEARNALLGRKSGRLTELMRFLPSLGPDDRRHAGAALNSVKVEIEEMLSAAANSIDAKAGGSAAIDLTMPSRHQWRGGVHPVSVVLDEIEEIFAELGFTVVTGPEVETQWYNFGALNFPPDHPAMDMHDTLYISDDVLLRTHTSPVQIRTLQGYPPPVRVLVPGNVYRRDFFDPSHAPAFMQLEGLAVDEGISFVDLKATLTLFANRFFGSTRTRFRPSYFPFTEPSAEMDVLCQLCSGSGCSGCKQSGWMEILGAGMVHPAVLRASGVDPERYSGWAFGMGPGRIAMQRFGIPDIRMLYDSDVRFLGQLSQ